MGKKISLGLSIAITLIVAAITLSLSVIIAMKNFNQRVSSITERENMYSKFTEVDDYVRQYYNGYIDEEVLMDAVAKGYLSGIDDPYAEYLSAEQYSDYLKSQTTVAGVGISVSPDASSYMVVNKVFSGSSAEVEGILKDDIIIKVDDIKLSADTYDEAVKLLTGDAGTKVTLTVRRDNVDTEYEITRRNVTEDAISQRMFGNLTYIHVDTFNSSTSEQFSKIVESCKNNDSTSLIIDLRGTADGLMSASADMLDSILGICDMLSVEYNDGKTEVVYSSNAKNSIIPIVVLINENTSGPGEFFAACLREYGKAKIVGARSKGCGSLQQVFKLEDGSAIKLTVGKFFLTDTHEYWEEIGVTPDYQISLDYTFDYSDITMIDENLDTQLSKAIEIISSSVSDNSETVNAE